MSVRAFSFTPEEYLSIRRRLLSSIYPHAGHLRGFNVTKKEWVLGGGTVVYRNAPELAAMLDYDFSEEKKFFYKNRSTNEAVRCLVLFVSRLWQIHAFAESNTRTTAVFFIKYLHTLGYAAGGAFAETHGTSGTHS